MESEAPAKSFNIPRTHVRHKSDITDVVTVLRMEEGLQTFEMRPEDISVRKNPAQLQNQGALSVKVIEEEAIDESSEEENLTNTMSKNFSTKTSDSLFPSIDIEVNVTISIDSGSILLHSGTTG